MVLNFQGYIDPPSHVSGGFDHADVYEQSRLVLVAHTANRSAEIIDGGKDTHSATSTGCPEASGAVCAQREALVFTASRGAGKVLVIDSVNKTVAKEVPTEEGRTL